MTDDIEITTELRIKALAQYLECDSEELYESSYDDKTFEFGSQDYLVCTDEEADQKAADYIRESVWAFNPQFLIAHMPRGIDPDMIATWQEKKCEGANDGLLAMIDDEQAFIDDAIASDGRGHFLNTWDGNEEEVELDGVTFYIYRLN